MWIMRFTSACASASDRARPKRTSSSVISSLLRHAVGVARSVPRETLCSHHAPYEKGRLQSFTATTTATQSVAVLPLAGAPQNSLHTPLCGGLLTPLNDTYRVVPRPSSASSRCLGRGAVRTCRTMTRAVHRRPQAGAFATAGSAAPGHRPCGTELHVDRTKNEPLALDHVRPIPAPGLSALWDPAPRLPEVTSRCGSTRTRVNSSPLRRFHVQRKVSREPPAANTCISVAAVPRETRFVRYGGTCHGGPPSLRPAAIRIRYAPQNCVSRGTGDLDAARASINALISTAVLDRHQRCTRGFTWNGQRAAVAIPARVQQNYAPPFMASAPS